MAAVHGFLRQAERLGGRTAACKASRSWDTAAAVIGSFSATCMNTVGGCGQLLLLPRPTSNQAGGTAMTWLQTPCPHCKPRFRLGLNQLCKTAGIIQHMYVMLSGLLRLPWHSYIQMLFALLHGRLPLRSWAGEHGQDLQVANSKDKKLRLMLAAKAPIASCSEITHIYRMKGTQCVLLAHLNVHVAAL